MNRNDRGRRSRSRVKLLAGALLATAMLAASLATPSAPTAVAVTKPTLVFSLDGTRVEPAALAGAAIPAGSNLSVWISPTLHPAHEVRFYVNGQLVQTEGKAPWDLGGTTAWGSSSPIWSSDLREGSNVIEARIEGWFNWDSTVRATFQRGPRVTTNDELGLDFGEAEQILDGYVRGERLNGAGLVVVHPDHGIVHESYRGEIDADRVSLLASSSKMISAGVLLHLADQGLLDLNAPISEVVDWGAGLPGVTPAQLLSNSSGLDGLAGIGGYLLNPCGLDPNAVLLDCGRSIAWHTADDFAQVPPDTQYRYGGPQWQVAGAVAEAVSGKSWHQLVDEIFVQPCGLEGFGYTALVQPHLYLRPDLVLQLLNNPMSAAYPPYFDGDLAALRPTRNPTVEGGGYSTPLAYAELLLMLLRGGRCGDHQVLSPAAIDMMLTDRIGPAYGGTNESGDGYGLGWTVNDDLRTDPGLFGAVSWLDLDDGYGAYFVIESVALPGTSGRGALIDAVERAIQGGGGDAGSLYQSATNAAVSGAFASDGVGVGVPNGTGSNGRLGPSGTNSSVTFTFDVPAPGNYTLVASIKSPNGQDDSFWVTVNGQPNAGWLWDTGVFSNYTEATVRNRGSARDQVVSLAAGRNQVSVHLREDGTYIQSMRLVATG